MTGQVRIDSYGDAGLLAAVALVNELAGPAGARGDALPAAALLPAIARVIAVDPPSVARLREADAPGFLGLAGVLRRVFEDLDRGDLDTAASRVNELLAQHPAHPHLAKEDGQWRLHHHPAEAEVVPMWTAICAEGVARMLGTGQADRLGVCAAADCERVFVDLSRNASRRFCSTTCQNRVKAAAFRRRQTRGGARAIE